MLVDSKVSHSVENTFMDTIFMFLHSIMFTLTLQISKLTRAVVLNFLPHERFWQFALKFSNISTENNLLYTAFVLNKNNMYRQNEM